VAVCVTKLLANALMQKSHASTSIALGWGTTGKTLPTPVLFRVYLGDAYIHQEPNCVPHLVDLLKKKIVAIEVKVQPIHGQVLMNNRHKKKKNKTITQHLLFLNNEKN
jgi:hypothetical protein